MASENIEGGQKETQVEFRGTAKEYFGIWIVNLLLSILTLGIYSAWAKVRRKKYFHHNTLIDGVGFDYHAKPIAILKGRIIAVTLAMLYYFGDVFHVIVPVICFIIFILALPWLVVRTSTFNARNTSHRGLRFDFIGKISEAVMVFILLPLGTLFSMWLLLPYADHQKNKFLMGGHRFGLSRFDMRATAGSFYKVYLIVMVLPIVVAVLGIVAAIAIPAYSDYVKKAKDAEMNIPHVAGFTSIHRDEPIVLALNEVDESEQKVQRIERVYSENAPAEMTPQEGAPKNEATSTTSDTKELEVILKEIETMEADEKTDRKSPLDMLKGASVIGALAMIGFMLVYALFIFGFMAYVKARIGNLVWNNTVLDNLSFKSTLRARDYLWIYLTNIVAIVSTFGLATPWAQIRLARYKASKLKIVGDVDFDQFVGDKKAEVKATGEEIADFFDLDLSFG